MGIITPARTIQMTVARHKKMREVGGSGGNNGHNNAFQMTVARHKKMREVGGAGRNSGRKSRRNCFIPRGPSHMPFGNLSILRDPPHAVHSNFLVRESSKVTLQISFSSRDRVSMSFPDSADRRLFGAL